MKRKATSISREYSFTVLYEPIKKHGYQVIVPLLPGVVTFGRTLIEAQKMARDAIRCHLEGLQKDRLPVPSEQALVQEKVTVMA